MVEDGEEGHCIAENSAPIGGHDHERHPPSADYIALNGDANVGRSVHEGAKDDEDDGDAATSLQETDGNSGGEELGIYFSRTTEDVLAACSGNDDDDRGRTGDDNETEDPCKNLPCSRLQHGNNVFVGFDVFRMIEAEEIDGVTHKEENHAEGGEDGPPLHDDVTNTIQEEDGHEAHGKGPQVGAAEPAIAKEQHERPDDERLHMSVKAVAVKDQPRESANRAGKHGKIQRQNNINGPHRFHSFSLFFFLSVECVSCLSPSQQTDSSPANERQRKASTKKVHSKRKKGKKMVKEEEVFSNYKW